MDTYSVPETSISTSSPVLTTIFLFRLLIYMIKFNTAMKVKCSSTHTDIYIYRHIHTERHTDRHTHKDTQTDRVTNTDTNTDTHRHTHIHTDR